MLNYIGSINKLDAAINNNSLNSIKTADENKYEFIDNSLLSDILSSSYTKSGAEIVGEVINQKNENPPEFAEYNIEKTNVFPKFERMKYNFEKNAIPVI